ncbi:SH2 domain-containing protein 2A isoform X1 [Leopardus geoffroyi]|uniref:SH2 domain-containing protein 2A isoform X1 n=1 Tax=Leopardus geoffroyi TaxID=46844 RepID=UPI001E26535A|nr:SH2 domain-containing protein 2A isoform X1 [Leopardus geoffroyi]XP_045310541.1 SH2 domain-containing protein 2A isoform X1 [Leopardus geoffroyi]XP_045310542.1 SH2 domain-containing protein 2A isoform X1 [Leopardus geoffroyi]
MEPPLAQICPQGSREAPAAAFNTFQRVELPHRSRCGLSVSQGPGLRAPKAEEAQPSPRVPAVRAVACPQPPGPASSPDTEKAEEVPGEGGQSLQAETRAWFQKTQAHWLLQRGAAPPWFHGFITRREAERLLEPKPEGCYLVRFSESAVTFVLTYRSRTCCRHFLLSQLGDGRHVVLGEDSAHARLPDLLRHYTVCPLSPYGETLSEPLARQQTPEPAGLSLSLEMSDSGTKIHPQYSTIVKKSPNAGPTRKEGAGERKEPPQPPRPKPPVPAKPQLPPEVYTSPAPRPRPVPPPKPSNRIYHEPDEPIAFYAMGRGSPGEAPGNVYAEVEAQLAPGSGGPPCALAHPALRKCRSRPVPRNQNPAGQQLHSENSVTGQGPIVPHQTLPRWGHTLPHKFSRQRTEDRSQALLPLGPPQ